MSAYFDAFVRYADFRGRSTRSQYWWFTACTVILFGLLVFATGQSSLDTANPLTTVIVLVHIVPSISVGVRRLHDAGHSGWLYLTSLIPVVGWVIFIVLACQKSEPSSNNWGEPVDVPTSAGLVRIVTSDFAAYRGDGSEGLADQREPTLGPQGKNEPSFQPAAAPLAGNGDFIAQLERLAALRASGALDDAEFQTMKANLLAKNAN